MTRSKRGSEEGRRLWCAGVAAWAAWVVVVGVAVVPALTAGQYGYGTYPDLPGSYCRLRHGRYGTCCPGRLDDCSMPIIGTLCYCDQFCNRTSNPDCCPDYWDVCLGLGPPSITQKVCNKDGIDILSGTSYTFNCNKCLCVNGRLSCEDDLCLVDEELMRQVNGNPRSYGWTASNYSMFWGRKASEGLVMKTGTLNPEALSMRMYPILLQPELDRIPSQFDARYKREWRGQISGVRDQGWCGASWAFSTLGVAQDRLAVASQGNESVDLSPQHLLSCDRRGQSGCKGGHVDRAWQYLRKVGVVNEGCFKYVSGNTGKVPECRIPRGGNMLTLRCAADEAVYKRRGLYRTEPAYRISGKEEDIQWEIMTNGPVQAMIKVQRDLFMYRRGVYAGTSLAPEQTASHSVRILGWGEETYGAGQPSKYWLVANSWGTEWGEEGLFRIRRGYNESGIETFVLAVRARLYDYDRRAGAGGRRIRHTLRHDKKEHHHSFYHTKRSH
ncbi:putative peptidase C1-like protein F26E4.3 [Chionoecetes opilio]|uniref:Putative peptidase C1-like protein F26E4.3 n=1 Tax=Chionoecetes opilio TaxID=41210 RepID=A0A8J4XXT3_CHIOP|nr:putative peptidase C1-like protein F26E4.3 [Chionoecetes opilio]